jgi:hypothetical protein
MLIANARIVETIVNLFSHLDNNIRLVGRCKLSSKIAFVSPSPQVPAHCHES